MNGQIVVSNSHAVILSFNVCNLAALNPTSPTRKSDTSFSQSIS